MAEYRLPEQCTIENAEQIHSELKALLLDSESLELNGADVEKADASFIQLLLALKKSEIEHNIAEPSDTLLAALSLYRLDDHIPLEQAAA